MIRLSQHADSWRSTLDRDLQTVRAADLDLIDCGLTGIAVTPRPPSQREARATDRADGNFQPTPVGASRPSGVYSDPTGRQVVAWEREVQDAVTRLFEVVVAAVEVAGGLGLTPVDEDGDELDPPAEPPTRVTSAGRMVIDAGPGVCRASTIAGVGYVAAVADRLADRMRAAADREVADALLERSAWVGHVVSRRARRLDRAPVRRCAAGCGAAAPPRGKGATCERCRQRQSRQSRAG